jgi:hypothetical protein
MENLLSLLKHEPVLQQSQERLVLFGNIRTVGKAVRFNVLAMLIKILIASPGVTGIHQY